MSTEETEPLHIRVRREFLKDHPGNPNCSWCNGSGLACNSADEYLISECDCVNHPFIERMDGRTICTLCSLEYFKHRPAPGTIRDWSCCYSIVELCNKKKVQL